jgi:hypothetical protein
MLRMRTREGQTLVEFSLLFSLVALMGLTIVTSVYHLFPGLTGAIGGSGP